MLRTVSARLSFTTVAQTKVAMAVAVAQNPGYTSFDEQLTVTSDGQPVPWRELVDGHGSRFHVLEFDYPADIEVEYTASVRGRAVPETVDEMDLIRYVRPSRYAESDRLLPTSYGQFGGMTGSSLVVAVRKWVHEQLSYVAGSSRGTDGAVETLLHRRGVCRDYAHLAIALLRAKDVPARLTAVYAPGLRPMDFHAVAEAYVDGAWHVIDPTGLASRYGMLRITAGRDSSDTAFLSTVGGSLVLRRLAVAADCDETLPDDDPEALAVVG
ncbi:transglutaminase-like domain-containing protein [Sinomonas terrae]|uniref:Transglutaminase family protein n=1 Tax=Sinomonas terrae TaxID=2908838 RepID=A0ABS9TZI6_9MICC|nr:transglutaminase family protein [Sinomonas terrae]MCH6469844.1 transglutaminase family protein [Sinomonas terrae]